MTNMYRILHGWSAGSRYLPPIINVKDPYNFPIFLENSCKKQIDEILKLIDPHANLIFPQFIFYQTSGGCLRDACIFNPDAQLFFFQVIINDSVSDYKNHFLIVYERL